MIHLGVNIWFHSTTWH